MRAANKKKGFQTCRYLKKKKKINMKILKTLQLDERPYDGLSILSNPGCRSL
jgi:hypothetical protein